MKKLAIGLLTYNRQELLSETLNSLFAMNFDVKFDAILIDNGSDNICQIANKRLAEQYNIQYIYNTIILSSDINQNIEFGHKRIIDELLKCDADMFCILEDDWRCFGSIPIEEIRILLEEHSEVGQVRIRDYKYDDTFYGGSSRHFITKEKIVFDEQKKINSIIFKIADMHWVNSCVVMRREILEYMDFPCNCEMDKMRKFFKKYPRNAQLIPGIFYHIGPERIRTDLREKGLFLDENIS